ncbi:MULTISPECIES: hypothetical protein [Pseudomonas]|uniref:hypothetical protein n=1 Tax=Pseudomonas TaxID=286 RepID=UPI0006D3BD3C|nr:MULTISPECIES: hypothetical protein [Pseudomonas]MCK2110300.1 hypothetical protein [Pseudomonas juntendi]MCK2114739.1 hypothetical protein [Pseudomonas juntendi]MCO7055774.1 hypothetical protein [Pseudomonas juntendi]MDG9808815.1 hypothetical protein [Pseudomonas juntendi]MDH1551595.1 hypothetical protein [Pseudomonas juntendi]
MDQVTDRPGPLHHARLAATGQTADGGRQPIHLLVQLALGNQGVALGWHHLVAQLVAQGLLVRPVQEELVLKDTFHFLAFNEDKENEPSCLRLRDWLLEEFQPLLDSLGSSCRCFAGAQRPALPTRSLR